jgi:type I restriction enzyme R subunit
MLELQISRTRNGGFYLAILGLLKNQEQEARSIASFFTFAQKKQQEEAVELIAAENLNEAAAKRYILASLKRGYASENGTELNDILPKMSPLNPQYLSKKQNVFQKIGAFVEKYSGVGGAV